MLNELFGFAKRGSIEAAIGEKLDGETRVRGTKWMAKSYFIPCFVDSAGAYHGLNEMGAAVRYSLYDLEHIVWERWTDPPKKEIVFEWMVKYKDKQWTIRRELGTEVEMQKLYKDKSDFRYQKTGRQFEVEK